MSIVATPEPGEATDEVAKIYAEGTASLGYVLSHTRVMATNPEDYRAWENLIGAIARPMNKRRYELIALAAAGALRSKACRLAHGKKSPKYISEDQPVRIARDYHDVGLSAAEVAVMEFAEKLGTDSAAMTDADGTTFCERGFTTRWQ
jgi:alkylhydroperoxidase family enzyme